jgi:hypothetical protein
MDRLPALLHLDERNRGAASGLRLRHENSASAPRRGAAADRRHQRAIVDRAFRSVDPHRHDHAPPGAGAAERDGCLDRAMRIDAGRRHPRLRALLLRVPVRGLGRQVGGRGDERGDVRHRGRGVVPATRLRQGFAEAMVLGRRSLSEGCTQGPIRRDGNCVAQSLLRISRSTRTGCGYGSRSLSSGARSRDPLVRRDDMGISW